MAGASILAMQNPEIGWQEVQLTNEARGDALLGTLPDRFPAYEWHTYQFALPQDAVPLARSDGCLQAFRIGDHVWALQFHPELTAAIAASWIDSYGESAGLDRRQAHLELAWHIASWNSRGVALCKRFLAVAATHAAADG